HLVSQPGEALFAAENGENVEYSRRGGAAGERRPQGLCDRAQLAARTFREPADGRFGGLRRPFRQRGEFRHDIADERTRLAVEQCGGLVVERERAPGEEVG